MSYKSLQEQFKNLTSTLNYCRRLFNTIASDKELPLDERWEFFCEFGPDFGKTTYSTLHLTNIDDCYYDIGFERYQTIELPNLYERIKNPPETLKEEMLQSGYFSFVYDW